MNPDDPFSIDGMDTSIGTLGNDMGPIQGPFTLDPLAPDPSQLPTFVSDPGNLAASTSSSSSSPWGSFVSGLATDASSLIGGLASGLTQTMAIDRNNQLRQNGYTVPLSAPGLNGGIATSTLFLFLMVGLAIYLITR